jgi:hypothetical protein
VANAPDYGVDLSCTTGLNPLLLTVTGSELMCQVALHRLYGRPGSLLSNPIDNTLDARDFLSNDITPQSLPRIAGQCVAALTGDQRIFSATVGATFDAKSGLLTLSIAGTGSSGPFNLTLAVSDVTVEILRP